MYEPPSVVPSSSDHESPPRPELLATMLDRLRELAGGDDLLSYVPRQMQAAG